MDPHGAYGRGFELLGLRLGAVTNNPALLAAEEYFSGCVVHSLRTNILALADVSPEDGVDGALYAWDVEGPGQINAGETEVVAVGPFQRLEHSVKDPRYSLFGNLGLFFKFMMAMLERARGIMSFHASGLYHAAANELILVLGAPGAGKTVLLLAGLQRGFTLFSTEMTHLQATPEGWRFSKGALYDNVRLGTLLVDFPEVGRRLNLRTDHVQDVWGTKIAVDLSPFQTPQDHLDNPKVAILLPKIEAGRVRPEIQEVRDHEAIVRLLFTNATEKIASSTLLYGTIPSGSLDTADLMRARYQRLDRYAASGGIALVQSILSAPAHCLDGYDRHLAARK
ncbi:MAG: hypothetical protein HY660_02430 [Armatimonadetes bacterium]|nr:hypothetical protein [Armatimonadota bacterium]